MKKQNKIIPLQDLNLLNRFLFDETMEDTKACQAMLEIALESKKEISLLSAESEKEMRTNPDLRAVRFDIFAQDDQETVYNAEMQGKNTGNLPRRSRYYQAHLDVTLLEIGETDFNVLNDSYMILIVPFDLFGKGKYKYTFRMQCEEDSSLGLNDGAVRIFLNTRGQNSEEVSKELIDFLHYIENPDNEQVLKSESPRIHQIHRRVCEVKASEEMGVRYMQEWEEKVYIRQEGREEGREEAIQILLELCSEYQIPQNEIVEKMIQKFSITEEEAQEYLKKDWK